MLKPSASGRPELYIMARLVNSWLSWAGFKVSADVLCSAMFGLLPKY